MKWEILSKADAKAITEQWNKMNPEEFELQKTKWEQGKELELSNEYRALRNELIDAWNDVMTEIKTGDYKKTQLKYTIDYLFALRLYRILNSKGFNIRVASNNAVWYFICIKVIPHIINYRFPEKSENANVNSGRFWSNSRRIYPKTLWWYVHLSFQEKGTFNESLNATEELLKNNTTDTIVQLVERSGHSGYRVDVYREIMKEFSGLKMRRDSKTDLFRKIMVLNTARTMTVEPSLCEGGTEGYVRDLFEYFGY